MQELWIPEDQSGQKCNIFVSSNFKEADRCLIIIQGTGEVRAGYFLIFHCLWAGFGAEESA